MAAVASIRDVSDEEFERQVLEGSRERPVVVDFWAPWCGPCRTLGPLLERVVEEYADSVILAKIDIDQNPVAASRHGVRSIPHVIGFRDGLPHSEFVGAQAEHSIRRFIEALLPTAADRSAQAAMLALAQGDPVAAETKFRDALALEPRHAKALLGLARLLAERHDDAEALVLLDRLVPNAAEAREVERLAARLRTRDESGGDEASLRLRLDADPRDLEARLQLGRMLAAGERYEAALEELMNVVRSDLEFSDQAARRSMLDLFEVLGEEDPLTQRFRRELARALFR